MDQDVSKCDINSINQRCKQSNVDNCEERHSFKAHLHNKLKAPIFKLNVDCLNKIFDYLSFHDVYAIGQTCRPMQQIATEYFQANHVTEEYIDYRDVKYVNKLFKIDEFGMFIPNLLFTQLVFPSRSLKKLSWYVGKYYKQELKRMRFYEADLTGAEIQNLWQKFEKVESVAIEQCVVNRIFYEKFPKLCKNLRRLYVEHFDCRRNILRRIGNEWLLWKYPKLEHLQWTQSNEGQPIAELKLFFERNPQVRSFTIDANALWTNRDVLGEISLDDLTVEVGHDEQAPRSMVHIYDCLKEFHEKGVYKRLHVNLKCFDQQTLNGMPPLDSLKSMCLDYDVDNPFLDPNHRITLPNWVDVTELNILSCCGSLNTDALARQLTNLQRIYFRGISLSNLMPFICHSVYLTKMKIKTLYCDDDYRNDIHVAALNEEREKLKGAKRMLIYVQEDVYLQSKWEVSGMEYSLIEVRRATSDEWCHQYGPQD